MKKAYFLADLHLGNGSKEETRHEERILCRFFDAISDDLGELFLLGDVLDYWFEYHDVVPRGFTRFFGKLAELADHGVKITWLIGNHDIWIFDYIPNELGVEVIDGILEREVLGKRFCMQHGDAIGGTKKFRLLRRLFRNKLCQKLYSGIHPRFTVSFAFNCSKKSRRNGLMNYTGTSTAINRLKNWCISRLKGGDKSSFFIFGHLHTEAIDNLDGDAKMIVVPCWKSTLRYGLFDGNEFQILQFQKALNVKKSAN